MTQDERWKVNYENVMRFIKDNKRNPSKYNPEERPLVNWTKQQRKLVNAGTLKLERVEVFNLLLAKMEECKRKNQYE
jgi:hypothetical protein